MDTARVREERLMLVRRLRTLEPEEWDRPSLCEGWTVRVVLAHLVTPFLVGTASMALTIMRVRGISAAMDATARRLSEHPVPDLLDALERNASSAFHPPGLPAAAPLTDAIIHSADIRWALGDERCDWGDPVRMRPVLDFLVSRRATVAFVPGARLRGLRLVATDTNWEHGAGAQVRGGSLALAMSLLHRAPAFDQLEGEGVAILTR